MIKVCLRTQSSGLLLPGLSLPRVSGGLRYLVLLGSLGYASVPLGLAVGHHEGQPLAPGEENKHGAGYWSFLK